MIIGLACSMILVDNDKERHKINKQYQESFFIKE